MKTAKEILSIINEAKGVNALPVFDTVYGLLANGDMKAYNKELSKMSQADLQAYITWADENGFTRGELQLGKYLKESLNKKPSKKSINENNYDWYSAIDTIKEEIQDDINNGATVQECEDRLGEYLDPMLTYYSDVIDIWQTCPDTPRQDEIIGAMRDDIVEAIYSEIDFSEFEENTEEDVEDEE